MSQISNSIRLKYGLGNVPTEQEVDNWLRLVNILIQKGHSKEASGDAAAKQLFPDFQTHFFASEADTIETLLQLAGGK